MRSDEQDEMSEVQPRVGQFQPGRLECVRDGRPGEGGQTRHVGRVAFEHREIRLVGRGPGRRGRRVL